MKTSKIAMILAPLAVTVSVMLIVTGIQWLIIDLGIENLHDLTNKIGMPLWVVKLGGFMNAVTFLAFFILGFISLKPNGAVGNSPELKTSRAYKYVRNPMYAGLSFTLFGIGLFIGSTGIALSGLTWLCICYMVTLQEEKHLGKRFGDDYIKYKESVPRFVPDFELLASDIFGIKKIYHKGNKKRNKFLYLKNNNS